LIENITQWGNDPDKYDIQGIDDPVPVGFTLKQTVTPAKNANGEKVHIGIFNDRTGEEVGSLFGRIGFDAIYLMQLDVDDKYRKLGLSRYLMREMNDFADEIGKDLTLIVCSYGEMLNDDLVRYYRSFGFVPNESDRDLIRRHHS
jgi:GNAT superfamily N-acetyltransferase